MTHAVKLFTATLIQGGAVAFFYFAVEAGQEPVSTGLTAILIGGLALKWEHELIRSNMGE